MFEIVKLSEGSKASKQDLLLSDLGYEGSKSTAIRAYFGLADEETDCVSVVVGRVYVARFRTKSW